MANSIVRGNGHVTDIKLREFNDRNRVFRRAVQRPRVEPDRPALMFDGGLVGMPGTDQIVLSTPTEMLHAAPVVSVEKGDLPSSQGQFSEPFVAALSAFVDRHPQGSRMIITIAEDKMRGPVDEQGNQRGVPDISAMDDDVDLFTGESTYGIGGRLPVSMRIAEHA